MSKKKWHPYRVASVFYMVSAYLQGLAFVSAAHEEKWFAAAAYTVSTSVMCWLALRAERRYFSATRPAVPSMWWGQCGRCNNEWFIRAGVEFVPSRCCYCEARFGLFTFEGKTFTLTGQPITTPEAPDGR